MSVEQVEITDQDIFKALEVLGLNTTEKTREVIEKAEKQEDKKEPEKEEGSEEEEDENEEEFEKAYSELKKAYPKCCDKMMSKSEIKKSEEDNIGSKVSDEIIKGFNDQIGSLVTLVKKQQLVNKELQESNESIKKSLEETLSKVEEIGSQSNGRKSFMSARKADYIEKSFGGEELNPNKQHFSLSRDKSKIDSKLLELSNIEKGEVNEFWKDACLLFNTSGVLDMQAIGKLSKEHNIQIVQ